MTGQSPFVQSTRLAAPAGGESGSAPRAGAADRVPKVPSHVLRRLRVRTGLWPGRRAFEGSLIVEIAGGPSPGPPMFWCVQTVEVAEALRRLAGPLARRVCAFSSTFSLAVGDATFDETNAALIVGLAAHYVEEVKRLQPQGPYFLAGYCAGSEIIYEMAQQLSASGEAIERLLLIEPAQSFELQGRLQAMAAWLFMKSFRLRRHAANLRALPQREWPRYVARVLKLAGPRPLLRWWRGRRASGAAPATGQGKYCMVRRPGGLRLFAGGLAAHAARHGQPYLFKSYPGRVTLVQGDASEFSFHKVPLLRPVIADFWRSRALGGFDFFTVPGDHDLLETQEGCDSIAALLSAGDPA